MFWSSTIHASIHPHMHSSTRPSIHPSIHSYIHPFVHTYIRPHVSVSKPISEHKETYLITFFKSTEMQHIMNPPALFYYSFNQYSAYVEILKRNDIPIFSFSIESKYTNCLGFLSNAPMHILCHDWMVLKCICHIHTHQGY